MSRVTKQRKALLNSLARSLVLQNKIKTTEIKAKELRAFIEKAVTKGKTDSVQTRRDITTKIGPEATKTLIESLSKKYKDRKGGYTRIIKAKNRLSDGSKMAFIEFV